jgi:ABC-2 type transport system ATP-binding protein
MSEPRLDIVALRAGYGRHVVLDGVSLRIEAGEWFVLLGPNGCGKSTLLDCVVGRMRPAAGEIRLNGHGLAQDPWSAKRQLGYSCAPESLPGLLTARQCLEVHAGAKGLSSVDAELLELAEELRFLPYLESFVDTLSLGTRQKLAVLLCLLGDPVLIVLDEAFNGLDPASALVLKRHLHSRLEQRGAALLLATHALDIVEHHADRTGLLVDGRLRHEWCNAEIRAMRAQGLGLDEAMAAALAAGSDRVPASRTSE